MTIKAERTGNLRKLTAEEGRILGPKGGVVDETVPTTALAIIKRHHRKVDPAALAEFLGVQLGRYRRHCDNVANHIPVAREIAIATETVEMISELRRRLELVPDLIQARADDVMWKSRGELWFSMSQRLVDDLTKAGAVLSAAVKESEKFKGKKGGKPAWARDALVRSVSAKIAELAPLRTRKAYIAEFTNELLCACGVPMPANIEDVKDLVRKAGKD